MQHNTQVPIGKHNNRQHASPRHKVATDVKQMPIRPINIRPINKEVVIYQCMLKARWWCWFQNTLISVNPVWDLGDKFFRSSHIGFKFEHVFLCGDFSHREPAVVGSITIYYEYPNKNSDTTPNSRPTPFISPSHAICSMVCLSRLFP